MLKLKCVLLLVFLPVVAFSQTKADYENVMSRFVIAYNNNQSTCICKMFPDEKTSGRKCFWEWVGPEKMKEKYGQIQTYSYLGIAEDDPAKVTVFKVVFEKTGTEAMSFTLDKEGKFGTFRFNTSSDEIEEMLKNAKY